MVSQSLGSGELLGREGELEVLLRACRGAAIGGGVALRLTGEPGMGKSALLAAAVDAARGAGQEVLSTRGVAEEQHLSFSALYRLIAPLMGELGGVPVPHRLALEAAFGLSGGDRVPERFLIALAVLELLVSRAGDGGLVVAVDDFQWLDRGSRDVVGFVARRVTDLPVSILIAERRVAEDQKPSTTLDGGDGSVQELELHGLDTESALALLRLRAPDLSRSGAQDVALLAEGNPLALLELPLADGVGRTARGVQWSTSSAPRLSVRLQQAFGVRVLALTPPSQFACLVAALQDSDALADTMAALEIDLENDENGPQAAIEGTEGLLRVEGPSIEFRHPLVRAAVIAQSDESQRQRAHRALGQALATVSSERSALHRAATARAPDAELSVELDALAETANLRGAAGLARSLFEQAARLSVSERAAGHRTLRAAELAFEMGELEDVGPLMASLPIAAMSAQDRARLVGLQMAFDDGVPEGVDAVHRFVSSARDAISDEQQTLAGNLLVVAARNTYWGATASQLGAQITSVSEMLGDGDEERLLALIVSAFLTPFDSAATVIAQLDTLTDAPLRDEVAALLSQAAYVVGDFQRSLQLATRASNGLRRDGRLALLAGASVLRAFSALYLGRWDIMLVAADEAERLAAETAQPVWLACARLGRANLLALRGKRSAAESIAAAVEPVAARTGNRALMNGVQLTRGLAALGADDPDRAFREFSRMFDEADIAFQSPQCAWALDYLAEAAIASGRTTTARGIVERIHELAGRSAASGVARSLSLAQLITAGEETELVYEQARETPATPWHQARLDLTYGAWLRRHHPQDSAGGLLRSAAVTFDALGAARWSGRARSELTALGEVGVSQTSTERWTQLSAQELQVANLAAQGLSNQEIAERLYISHRTVASHLYRIYPKLGVRSRSQLHLVLPEGAAREYGS